MNTREAGKSAGQAAMSFVMGLVAFAVMVLAPIVLLGGTYGLTRWFQASTNMMLVLCGIAVAASIYISGNAYSFGKFLMKDATE